MHTSVRFKQVSQRRIFTWASVRTVGTHASKVNGRDAESVGRKRRTGWPLAGNTSSI